MTYDNSGGFSKFVKVKIYNLARQTQVCGLKNVMIKNQNCATKYGGEISPSAL